MLSSNEVYKIAEGEFGKHVYMVPLRLFRSQVLCYFLCFKKIGSPHTYICTLLNKVSA